MLIEESIRIKQFVEKINPQGLRVLNLGSGDKYFREVIQPYVQENIIAPFEERGNTVVNMDLYGEEGIDLRLDFANLHTINGQFDVVMCSNSFEHSENRPYLGEQISRLTKSGGYILVTTPYVFPYHLDPIDTLYRPTPEEQATLIPDCDVLESEILTIKLPYWSRGMRLPLLLVKALMVVKSINYKLHGEKFNFVEDLGRIFKTWKVTYLVMQKKA